MTRILTADNIKRIALESAKDCCAINYYGRSELPPSGHRPDCNPRLIPTGNCICMELEKEGYDVKFRRG